MKQDVTKSVTVIDWEGIAFREIGFGQPVNIPLEPIQFRVDFKTFLAKLSPDFNEHMDELRLMGEEGHRMDFGTYEIVSRLGYPNLEELINHPKDCAAFLTEHLAAQTLGIWLKGNDANPKTTVNSIDMITLEKDEVVLHCSAFRHAGSS